MKTKNLLIVFCALFLSTFGQHLVARTNIQEQEIDFDCFIENDTPLQFSSARVRDFFRSNRLPTIALKGREKQDNEVVQQFNGSLQNYITEVYNARGYAQQLSQDGTHIIELLELCNDLGLDATTVYSCLRLFYNKMKAAELVDDTVVQQLLEPLPNLLKKYFKKKEEEQIVRSNVTFLRENTENIMLSRFTEHYDYFQKEPDMFITKLTNEIDQAYQQELAKMRSETSKNDEDAAMTERLRQTVVKFFEITLGKTIWHMQAYEGIWDSFLSLANNLQMLGVHGILDHMDDLDDLLWSLVHRFNFFLDLRGSTLPPAFFDEIESDIASGAVFFLEEAELDEGIKSKKELLIKALANAKTKSIAFRRSGIFSEPMV